MEDTVDRLRGENRELTAQLNDMLAILTEVQWLVYQLKDTLRFRYVD